MEERLPFTCATVPLPGSKAAFLSSSCELWVLGQEPQGLVQADGDCCNCGANPPLEFIAVGINEEMNRILGIFHHLCGQGSGREAVPWPIGTGREEGGSTAVPISGRGVDRD